MTEAVTNSALKAFVGLERPKPQPVDAPEAELAVFVGRYSRPMLDLELGMLGGRLIAQAVYNAGFPAKDSPPPPAPPPATLTLCEKDRLLVLDGIKKGATIDVIRNPDSTIGWLRFGGRIHRRED